MTLCMFAYQKILCVYVLEKVKTILYFFFGHSPTVVDKKYFRWKWTLFRKIYKRAPKFLLILTALFGHQPTYKSLRGNTGIKHKISGHTGTYTQRLHYWRNQWLQRVLRTNFYLESTHPASYLSVSGRKRCVKQNSGTVNVTMASCDSRREMFVTRLQLRRCSIAHIKVV